MFPLQSAKPFRLPFNTPPGPSTWFVIQLYGNTIGAYQWRDAGRLFVIPLEMGAASNVLWEVDAASGEARRVTDPTVTPFRIAGGDWAVSPDGQRLVFVSADDRALWLLTLP